ncbi:UDP-glucose 6-dehydrogenase [Actinopolyspora erythraea]|uniref:UDP-glucose 6-dehydrogenase n=1 Tax=Actinopolyspora erythraea TaxID=414996 RepID=A0A099D927_9ACTN|nr:nucleotide sugar dehydrogenase [Actinopolyspora erythraea]ASU78396.1 UDP-glucose 6-dehydrogenase [Actinopolyspora erythraea]KGI81900.1 UDP-glucose 6-dehydrogenase [Actinopolyspora erythraea]
MGELPLSLAVNGREYEFNDRLVSYSSIKGTDNGVVPSALGSVAVVGLGYVGLPTVVEFHAKGVDVIGVDTSQERLRTILDGEVELAESDREALRHGLGKGGIRLTSDSASLGEAEAIVVCVPTPVREDGTPDLAALRAACADVAGHARPGQTVILTSTTYVGTTRELLVEPLRSRGLVPGQDVHVAFSAERIDPGNPDHRQQDTPRVVGGVTERCSVLAAEVINQVTGSVFLVSSPEAAELTKLYENIFRAVTLALANEFAEVCRELELDPIEVTLAAGTKPYGFLGGFPGPGVGGHCIPCDPYYLLWQLRGQGRSAPLLEQVMRVIRDRPQQVVTRVAELLKEAEIGVERARVLVVGVSYKAGVADLRESPALPILAGLADLGAEIGYYDPLVPRVRLPDGTELTSRESPASGQWDLVLVHTPHPGFDYRWVGRFPLVLDATYRFDHAPHRRLV